MEVEVYGINVHASGKGDFLFVALHWIYLTMVRAMKWW